MRKEGANRQTTGPVDQEVMRGRALFCTVLILVGFLLLAMRLWQVQVLSGHDLQARARRQSIRPVRINSVRGSILDVSGKTLVDNVDTYDLVFYVSEMRQPGRQIRTIEHILTTERMLAGYLGRPSQLDEETVRRQLRIRPVLPLTVFEDLTAEELAAFAEFLPAQPGVEVEPVPRRKYHYPGILSHVLGYTGRVQPDGNDVLEDLPRLYATPELRGRSGLEKAFDKELSGKPGAELLLVDPIGYARETIGSSQNPEDGNNLHLTIDINAQRIAEEELRGHVGAMVVVNVDSGAVVAMASSPTYNLEGFSNDELVRLMKDEKNRPMFNRATQGTYTPGSIVKPLVALAALQEIPDVAAQEYDCTGRFKIGNASIRCARRYGHGLLGLHRSIVVSCNPFLINLGMKLGIDLLSEYMADVGFGERTGLELTDAAGICPSREVARRLWRRNWIAIDTAYTSIGQGAITVTPLQAAMYAAAIANGGALYRPYLVERVETPSGQILQETAPVIRRRLSATPEEWAVIHQAMIGVVEDEDGGGAGMKKAGIPVAAKTGTAEVGSGENRHKNTWIIAFVPADQPKYALACLVERGVSGGKTAVPIAAEFLRRWLVAE